MQDKGEESGQVGEDAGQDDRVPCLVVNYAVQQLHALINRQFLVGGRCRKKDRAWFSFHVLLFTRSLQKNERKLPLNTNDIQ